MSKIGPLTDNELRRIEVDFATGAKVRKADFYKLYDHIWWMHAAISSEGKNTVHKWQPIETAPKDGTIVDLWCRRSWDPPVKYERSTDMYFCQTFGVWRSERNLHFVERQWDGRDRDPKYDRWLIPEFWMPRPDAPDVPS